MAAASRTPQDTAAWLAAEYGLQLSVPNVGERYELFDELGAGGAGQVYVGLDKDLDRRVAIKVLHTRRHESRDAVCRFLNEARITARLQHPGIPPVHDIGLLGGDLFFAMEVVEGRTLRQVLDERAADPEQGMSTDELVRLFQQICHTVAYAHDQGVMHCDLKPENIMVGHFNKVYVVDWGLALDRHPHTQLADRLARYLEQVHSPPAADAPPLATQELHALPGTPRYMAPERIVSMGQRIDARSDVYALGLILYEILAGAYPFPGESTREVMHAIMTAAVPPINTPVSGDLKLVCLQALARIPAQRYPHAGALAEDLHRALTLYPVAAQQGQVMPALLKAGRRHWLWVCVLLLAAALAGQLVVTHQREVAEVTRTLDMANACLASALDFQRQARSLEPLVAKADAKWQPRLQRNLDLVLGSRRTELQAARRLLTLAVLQRPQQVSPSLRAVLRQLWLDEVERNLQAERKAEARRLYHELRDLARDPAYFVWSPDDAARLAALEQELGRAP
jgi:serine/threonine-protein kinase